MIGIDEWSPDDRADQQDRVNTGDGGPGKPFTSLRVLSILTCQRGVPLVTGFLGILNARETITGGSVTCLLLLACLAFPGPLVAGNALNWSDPGVPPQGNRSQAGARQRLGSGSEAGSQTLTEGDYATAS